MFSGGIEMKRWLEMGYCRLLMCGWGDSKTIPTQ